jgi:hypothetical protein
VFEPERHEPLSGGAWQEADARAAIAEIAADALARFDRARLWPTHPMEDHGRDGDASLYMGASGVIWALDYLGRAGLAEGADGLADAMPAVVARARDDLRRTYYPNAASFLIGDVGALLVQHRLSPSAAAADELHERVEADDRQPVRELMWGTPGCLLTSLFMLERTGEARWRDLFREQAERLWREWREVPGFGFLWTQELYRRTVRYLGLVHGFAGNAFPLIKGEALLDVGRREELHARALTTLTATACADGTCANWAAGVHRSRPERAPHLVQQCHGAPGLVTALAGLPAGRDPAADRLFAMGGELIWRAGPLVKGPNLCHGTAGNGYAFLKLYRRTGDPKWLARARAFALHAVGQCREARRRYGQGRYSLWTGDLGLAVYLRDCIEGEARFPTLDVF